MKWNITRHLFSMGCRSCRAESLPDDLEGPHLNLNDDTVEGVWHRKLPAFSVQYHPEASAGPHDSNYLFGQFRAMLP